MGEHQTQSLLLSLPGTYSSLGSPSLKRLHWMSYKSPRVPLATTPQMGNLKTTGPDLEPGSSDQFMGRAMLPSRAPASPL